MIASCIKHGFPLEFSSALPHHCDAEKFFASFPLPKSAHNYFPAPQSPFVINLASSDPEIRSRSVNHCIAGLKLCSESQIGFFSAHAGFMIDPPPHELGQKLTQKSSAGNRPLHWNLFLESVRSILVEAERLNMDFYIENNVVAKFNLGNEGENPLLCGHPDEIVRLCDEIGHPRFGILLDTAHLKVSSGTLNFDLLQGADKVLRCVKMVHHSDNNGLVDSNELLPDDYWFAPFMVAVRALPQVLEVKSIDDVHIQRQIALLRRLMDE